MSPQRKTLAGFEAAPQAQGYENTVIWRFKDDDGINRSGDFSSFEEDLGSIVAQLVSAAIRLTKPTTPRRSHQTGQTTLRRFLRYLKDQNWDKQADVTAITANTLLDYGTTFESDTTARTSFNKIRQIVNEALRPTGMHLSFPYGGVNRVPNPTGKRDLGDANIKKVLDAARNDVSRIWSDFQQFRSSEATTEMREVAAMAEKYGGVLPRILDDPEFHRFYYKYNRNGTQLPLKRWNAWLYATSDTIIPFLILILYGLAGNVVSVLEARRDLMQTKNDPFRGARATVAFFKRRSGRWLTYGFKDAGRFSVPTLIRQVLAMTEPLVPHVPPAQRERLFLAYGSQATRGRGNRKVTQLNLHSTSYWIRDFGKRHDLRDEFGKPLDLRLEHLRVTRINAVQRKSNDVFVTQKVANHMSVTTTLAYLKRFETMQRERELIADIQTEYKGRELVRVVGPTHPTTDEEDRARGIERDCLDPLNQPGSSPDSACPQWNYSLTDPNLVIPPEPRFVAAILRDLYAYRDARKHVDQVRFDRLYASRLSLLENIAARFRHDAQLMQSAEELAKAMTHPEIR